MRKPVAFDPNFKNRGKGRRRGQISVDTDSQNLTGSLTFYSPPEPPQGGYIIVSDSNTIKGIGVASAKPVFWTADDSTIVDVVNGLPGNNTTINNSGEAFEYLSSNNYYVITPSAGNIVTDKLVLELDATKKTSYPTTGSTWYDTSGLNNNATLKSPTQFNSEGYFQYGGNGVDDESSITTVEVNTNTSEGNTVEQWIWSDERDGNGNMPFTWWNQSWDLWAYGNYFGINNGSSLVYGITGADDILIGKWNHVVTYFPNNWATSYQDAKMWINGVSQSLSIRQGSLSNKSLSSSQTVGIGGGYTSGGDNFNWDGRIATTRIYAKELSHSEVLQNYYEAPNIPSGVKIALDTAHPISCTSSGWNFDLAQQYNNLNTAGYQDSDLGTDFDEMTEFTYCLWIKVYSTPSGYSHTPFAKYEGTSTAVVRVYHFGDTSGIDNRFGFYLNAGGGWTGYGAYYADVGETFFLAMQYNSTTGGKVWVNGKPGSRGGRTGTIATNNAGFTILPDDGSSQSNSRIKAAYVYTHELTDQEITDLYTSTQAKYGL